jgi:hypothetical protein
MAIRFYKYAPNLKGIRIKGLTELIHSRSIEEGECWIWQGAMHSDGNPVMYVGQGVPNRSVRYMIALKMGIENLNKERRLAVVHPSCGDRRCVNPKHISIMTRSMSMKQTAEKTGYGKQLARSKKLSDLARARSPLSIELVREIRSSPESGRAMARRLGVAQQTIAQIRANKTWADFSSPYLQLMK